MKDVGKIVEFVKESEPFLYNADENCDHEIVAKWSGIECKKCKGWFCY